MPTKRKHEPTFKFWLECDGKPILGKGGAQILRQIEKDGSITNAAESLGMSYRFVWNYVHKVERVLGEPVVESHRGGRSGGGGASLTKLGRNLLIEYDQLDGYLNKILSNVKSGR
jgi:molybdate transport system regulatory protein